MPKANPTDALNLSGLWHGQYGYPNNKRPVAFTVTMTETNSWLNGVVEETGTVGEARGLTIGATVQGRRTGHDVTWLKFYHGSYRGYDSVSYEGEVSVDGTEIAGRWTIHANWSGRFLMVRQKGAEAVQARKASAKA
jgi:hypothetical protein